MICFSLSEEQAMMKDTISKLVQNNIKDNVHEMDEKGFIPDEFVAKFHDLGTVVSMIPEEYGGYGMGNSPVMNCIILEELAFGDMGYAVATGLASLFLLPIVEMGTDEQKKKYLPAFAEGDISVPCPLAISEMSFKFDPAELSTTAVKKNGSYILNGKKCFVPLAENAKFIMVAAALDGKNNIFIVDRKNPGLKISEVEKNLGLNTLKTNTVTIENCEVPGADRLGGETGVDFDRILQKTRTAMAAIGTGIARASYEYALNYAKERSQFGEPIASRQAVAFMLAEMAYETDAMRLMTWKAASALEAGRDAARESFLAKIYAGEMAMKLTDYGVQVLGGHGYIREHPVERYYRNARGIAILEGMAIA